MGINFEDKYGYKETNDIKQFHMSRIMFAIKDDKLYIADNTSNSHATWFSDMGWITESNDELMNSIVRGYVNSSGIYFYKGYNFEADSDSEKIMISKLSDLVRHLELSRLTMVYAGVVKQEGVGVFPPKKCLGKVIELQGGS